MNEISCPYCHGITDGTLDYCQECGHQIYHCPTCHTPIIVYQKNCANDHTKIPGPWLKGLPKPEVPFEKGKDTGPKDSSKGKPFSRRKALLVFIATGIVLFLILGDGRNPGHSQNAGTDAASGSVNEGEETYASDESVTESPGENSDDTDSSFDYRDPYAYVEYDQTHGTLKTNEEVYSEPADVDTEYQTESEEYVYDGQVFPYSSIRKLKDEEIYGLSLTEIQDAINEIYARNGYTFNDPKYLNYYKSFDWYHPTISSDQFNERSEFNDVEFYNVEKMRVRRDALKNS